MPWRKELRPASLGPPQRSINGQLAGAAAQYSTVVSIRANSDIETMGDFGIAGDSRSGPVTDVSCVECAAPEWWITSTGRRFARTRWATIRPSSLPPAQHEPERKNSLLHVRRLNGFLPSHADLVGSEQLGQIATAVHNADDLHGLDRSLVRVGMYFVEYEKMPLDQQPGSFRNVGTARANPGMVTQQFDFLADGQQNAVGGGSLSLSSAR
jgi:hypothetical protein